MHAVRLGFVNWGVRKVSGMSGSEAIHRERTAGGGEKRSQRRCLTASRTTTRVCYRAQASKRGSKTGSKFEAETLAVAHHPAAAWAREMPADHEHGRSGKPPQERPAGAIRLRGIEIGGR
jgi:hypothetical protein